MKLLIIVSLTVLVLTFIALNSGAYNIAATDKHWAITEKLISWVRDSSIKARAKEMEVPVLDDPVMVEKGFKQYHAMCTECHLSPGKKPTALAIGLYPQAPLFYERAPVTDEGEKSSLSKKYFWAIKNGIKMTAMPAWGPTHNDETIWTITAFLQKLHGMTAERYAALVDAHRDDLMHEHEHEHNHDHNHGHHH
ncbi:cytochrome c [Nitrosomonas sp. Nm33]|uniref:c-type cytochrome n=1 Tax=Nitrosomonas sp. Nm33 TaxID=133724 RepID=UPI000898C3D7|nr:cytochrome c [Nitrosomonas sp. Nm33]SDY07524.1 Cytochrome C oxidase, cbb3-type, subunit III [Nitrosomonas sp. Nm33]